MESFHTYYTKKGGELFQGNTIRQDKRAISRCFSRLDLCRCALYAAGTGVQSARNGEVIVLGVRVDESDLPNAYRFPSCAPTYNQDMMTAGEEVAALCRSAYCNWFPVAASSTSTPP